MSRQEPTTENDAPVVAPPAQSLIRELREHHTTTDPENVYGFNSEEIWEYRLRKFGYRQLFLDWYGTIGSTRVTPPAKGDA
jgi:hypothetical protein